MKDTKKKNCKLKRDVNYQFVMNLTISKKACDFIFKTTMIQIIITENKRFQVNYNIQKQNPIIFLVSRQR